MWRVGAKLRVGGGEEGENYGKMSGFYIHI